MNKSEMSNQFREFMQSYKEIWWNTDKTFPKLGIKTDYWYKKKKERETDKFIESFLKHIESFPEMQDDRVVWKKQFDVLLHNFISTSNIITEEDKEILFNKELIKSTEAFFYEAKAFNKSMSMDEIGQAMRNVWIMNIIQLLLNRKTEFTPAVFGYSMLYPYTDNYLDDIEISFEEKNKFNERFEKRLKGSIIQDSNSLERDIYSLISRIESQYERSNYPQVFESLLMIHHAQKKSIIQQDKKTTPYERDILGISFEKGGVSVLADAYLVNGTLSYDQANFFFGYGVSLQICDDLQDAKVDLDNNHMTIISQIARRYPMDHLTNSLLNFTINLIDEVECFDGDNIKNLKQLIRKNCILLIYFAIVKNKKFYSREYFNEIKEYFPYTDRYMKNFYSRFKKRFSKLEDSYNGTKVEEILMYIFKNEEI